MQEMEVMDIFQRIGAYKQGHFMLSSGLHSGAYFQCALVLQDPVIASRLCKVLAEKIGVEKVDIVVGPAMGGIVMAYEMARALNARSVFTERDVDGKMVLRRGFMIPPSSKVIIAEDVLTTGGSAKEVIALLNEDGIKPAGIVSLVDRSTKPLDFGTIRYSSLIKMDAPAFNPTNCPLCQEGLPVVKPGSRKIS